MSSNTILTNGKIPTDDSYKKLKPDGQQEAYIVLSEEERAKGFVEPVRYAYVHTPIKPNNLRDLTSEEVERYSQYGYYKYEEYSKDKDPLLGKYWTKDELERLNCGGLTTISASIAETYARNPKFYGATFCCSCEKHFPVNEFVWDGTNIRVGSRTLATIEVKKEEPVTNKKLTTDEINDLLADAYFEVGSNDQYQHYKGGVYQVDNHAIDTTTGEIVVMYHRIDGPNYNSVNERDIFYTRPLKEWHDVVDGKKRFVKVTSELKQVWTPVDDK